MNPTLNQLLPGTHLLGTRVPGCFNAFEMAARAVLGQQVTVRAASTLAGRVAADDSLGQSIETGMPGLERLFPTAETIAQFSEPGEVEDRLGPLGVTRIRARSLLAIARAMTDGSLRLGPSADPEATIAALQEIPGIGPWTANYLGMRALGWPDSMLDSDVGVQKALAALRTGPGAEGAPSSSEKRNRPSPALVRELAEAWRPWRSYATVSLWNTL